jgi:hypothetical protein
MYPAFFVPLRGKFYRRVPRGTVLPKGTVLPEGIEGTVLSESIVGDSPSRETIPLSADAENRTSSRTVPIMIECLRTI